MKKIFILLIVFCSLQAWATKYFISPSGNDTPNTGTISSPWFTLLKAWSVVAAGDTIYARGGTYTYTSMQSLNNKSGTAGNLIKIWAYPNEIPIFTRHTGNRLIDITSNYLHVKGIDISGCAQLTSSEIFFPLTINSSHSIFEDMAVHDNSFGMNFGGTSGDVLVLNCDLYRNQDPLTSWDPYGGADGLRISANSPTTTITIRNCRMWWNSDDGVDQYGNYGTTIFENCWAFWNGYIPGSFVGAGNGMGFKFGPIYGGTTEMRRVAKNLLSFENRSGGYDQGADGTNFPTTFYNCVAYKNGEVGFNYHQSVTAINILRNNISYANPENTRLLPASIQDHNSWNGGVTLSNADFLSISSTGMDGARGSGRSFPAINFLKLATGSDLIDAGINVGLPYNGSAPDIGSFEYTSSAVIVIPTLTLNSPSNVGAVSVIITANVISDGGGAVTERGVVWSTSANPTTANSKQTNGTGVGSYSNTISGLTPSTTYYIRAYAINSAGTSYSNQVTVTTVALETPVTLSAVTLDIPYTLASRSISIYAAVTNDGDGTVSERGICWGTTTAPTTSNYKFVNGDGLGVYYSQIYTLTPSTTYYMRAFCINEAGTSYSNEISFKTAFKSTVNSKGTVIQYVGKILKY